MMEEVRYSQNQLSAHSRRIALLEARITPSGQLTTSPGNSSEPFPNLLPGSSDHVNSAEDREPASAMNSDNKNIAKNANTSPSRSFIPIPVDSVVTASHSAKNFELPNIPQGSLELTPHPTAGHDSSGSGSDPPPSHYDQQGFINNPSSGVDVNKFQQLSSCVSNENLHPFPEALHADQIIDQMHQNQSNAMEEPVVSNSVNQIVRGDNLIRQPFGVSAGSGNVMLPVSSSNNSNNFNHHQQQIMENTIASSPSSIGGFSGGEQNLPLSTAEGRGPILKCSTSTSIPIMSNGDVMVKSVATEMKNGLHANQCLLHNIGHGLGEPPLQPPAAHPANANALQLVKENSNLSSASDCSDQEMESPDKLTSLGLNCRTPGTENRRKRKNTNDRESEVEQIKLPRSEPRKINEFFSKVRSVSPPNVPSVTPQTGTPNNTRNPCIVPDPSNGNNGASGELDGGRVTSGSRSTTPIISDLLPLNNPVAVTTPPPPPDGGEASLSTVSLIDDAAQTSLTSADMDESQRLIGIKNMQLESLLTRVSKGAEVTKQLLIEKCVMERKEARTLCIKNNRRLGQYRTELHGDHYEEKWVDGAAFKELDKKQARIAAEREELDRQKKLLIKRKPSNSDRPGSRKSQTGTTSTAAQASSQSAPSALDVVVAEPPGSAQVDYVFAKPDPPKEMTIQEYYEADEILKLRVSQNKKEEAELQQENERLERETNLHVRESKRLQNEDRSKYNDFTVLGGNGRYLLLSMLGKGGFSEVYRAFDLEESRFVACKIHLVNPDWKDEQKINYVKHAMREKDIHKTMDHPRIVRLYDVFSINRDSFCTVLEYCDGHDLDFYLKQHKCIPEKEARSIIMQLVSALHYLNLLKPSIIHYDLKPANVLLTKGAYGEIKVTDFGLSKKNHEGPNVGMELTSQFSGTFWYLPPETFLPNGSTITSKVDVWSVGVIFYQCLYGERPFGHHLSQQYILENKTILNATEVTFPNKPVVSNDAKKFIRCCLQYRQEDRYDVMKLYNHDYLRPKSALRSGLSVGGGVAGNSLAGASAATSAAANLSPGLPCTPAFPVAPHTAGAYQTHHQQQQNVDRVQQTAAAGRITDGGGGNVATTAADCSTASTANGGASGSQLSLG